MAMNPTSHHKSIEQSKATKFADERMWSMSLLFLEGRQNIQWDRNLKQYASIRAGGRSRQITINLLINVYRNISARLRTAYPSVICMPASPSSEDIVKATMSETALRYYWMRGDMKNVIAKSVDWLLTAGTTAYHTYYDPNDKEVKTVCVDPYSLFFEPGTENPEDSTKRS